MNIIFNNPAETLGAMRQDPLTIAAVAGTALSAMGSIQAGQAAKAEADYNAQISQQNAEIARQQTQAATETQDRERRLRMGASRAAAGASGIGSESFGDVLSSSAMQEELDLLTLESEGLLQARDFEAQGSLLKAQGRNARTAGYINAASDILGGSAKAMGGMGGKENFGRTKTGRVPKPSRKPVRY